MLTMLSQNNDSIESTTPLDHRLQPDNEAEEHAGEDHELSMHVSCPHCKHYHRHTLFTLPKDDSKHTRFKCTTCEYPIMGIGRSSTQTTLASVDSILPATDGRPRMPQKAPCTNSRLPRIQTNSLGNTQPTNRLTPLVERSPIVPPAGHEREKASRSIPMDSSSKSHIKFGPGTKPGVLHKVDSKRQESKSTRKWSLSYAWDRMRSFKGRAKDRLLKRQRGSHSSRATISEELNSPSSPVVSDVVPVTGTQGRESEDPDEMIALERSAKASDAVQNPSTKGSFSKEERVRQFRSQKTLERKALTQAVCECEKDCHCYSQHHTDPREMNSTMSPQCSISIDAVPAHPLDRRPLTDPGSETSLGPLHLPSYQFGQQFPTSLDHPIRFSILNSTDSNRSRDSQALTQVGSDASTSGSSRTMHEIRPASSTGFRTTASRSLRHSGNGSVSDRRSFEEARRQSLLNQAEISFASDPSIDHSGISAANTPDGMLEERRPQTT